ncbi:MAG: hypothetical protein K940chlam1_00656 [Candidatus Anoxychlamydiales bacterium]|nr:hypothetical protein [Candidatus Anoxychlamydiales bacterium]NGX36063.1 hypothetical protein [Candidatus Anoxychlamydiales bacterium]
MSSSRPISNGLPQTSIREDLGTQKVTFEQMLTKKFDAVKLSLAQMDSRLCNLNDRVQKTEQTLVKLQQLKEHDRFFATVLNPSVSTSQPQGFLFQLPSFDTRFERVSSSNIGGSFSSANPERRESPAATSTDKMSLDCITDSEQQLTRESFDLLIEVINMIPENECEGNYIVLKAIKTLKLIANNLSFKSLNITRFIDSSSQSILHFTPDSKKLLVEALSHLSNNIITQEQFNNTSSITFFIRVLSLLLKENSLSTNTKGNIFFLQTSFTSPNPNDILRTIKLNQENTEKSNDEQAALEVLRSLHQEIVPPTPGKRKRK